MNGDVSPGNSSKRRKRRNEDRSTVGTFSLWLKSSRERTALKKGGHPGWRANQDGIEWRSDRRSLQWRNPAISDFGCENDAAGQWRQRERVNGQNKDQPARATNAGFTQSRERDPLGW